MRLTIAHLYPDLFHLYGDQGNVQALRQRLLWRGLDCRLVRVSLADPFQPEDYDIVYLGGGLEWQNELLRQDFLEQKAAGICQAVEQGTVFLAVNGGFWLMGQYLARPDGSKLPGLGILDAWSTLHEKRITGKVVSHSAILAQTGADPVLFGFANRLTSTRLGAGVAPLAQVLAGPANNSQQNVEGAIYKNLYCTYMLGGYLPLNPDLTDYLLNTALLRRYADFTGLAELPDPYTENARKAASDCR